VSPGEEGGARILEQAPIQGWARRTLYGGGGPAGSAWRAVSRPLGWAWGAAADLRHGAALEAARLDAPVVSVGNVTLGGGGKTSLVLWLLEHGLPREVTPAVLTRGYGRAEEGVVVLEPGAREWRMAGDEPALIARAGAWVGVAADRVEAARAVARRVAPDCFVLDDGLQHVRVARSLDLVTFTEIDLSAPARCLPAGPLRQGPGVRPPVAAWIVTGADPRERRWPAGSIGEAFAGWWSAMPGTPATWRDAGTVSLAAWRTGGVEPFDAAGAPVVAFAGVARPEPVVDFAARAGIEVRALAAFPDHRAYGVADVARLLASHPGAAFVTTEKDAAKCEPEWFGDRPVGVLRRRLDPQDPGLLTALVREAMAWPR